MSFNKWFYLAVAAALAVAPSAALAQGHGNGRGHDKEKDKHERAEYRDDGDRGGRGHGKDHNENKDRDKAERHYYRDHDRELHGWYQGHRDHLPPGLAKRDELPPGLQRQLVVRGTLPPGLRTQMHPCPVEVAAYLPPPPMGYMHTVIGGQIVLVNRKTFFVLDVFHF